MIEIQCRMIALDRKYGVKFGGLEYCFCNNM